MGRWTGSWLAGPAAAGLRAPPVTHPGQRLGLPVSGPGSVASFPRRLGAFLVDAVVANLLVGVTALAGWHSPNGLRGVLVTAAFGLEELVLLAVAGQTLGMRWLGVRVLPVRGRRLTAGWLAVRTLLLLLLVPALFWDRDNRGLHDRAAGVVVVLEG